VARHLALFPVGADVRVVRRERLEEFRRTWQLHHPLDEAQIPHGGTIARIAAVSFYHGDALYTLENVPGVWHEACLAPAHTSHSV
jgi:hypothetical protein